MARRFIGNVKGVGIDSVAREYYSSTSASAPVGGTWNSIVPVIDNAHYLWTRFKTTLTDGSVSYTEPLREGMFGEEVSNILESVSALQNKMSAEENKVQPIAKGGTGATTAAKALVNLGAMNMRVVWQNASPSSSFAAQTIKLNLSGYDFVYILMKASVTAANSVVHMVKKGASQNLEQSGNLASESAIVVLYRNASVAEDGIVFGGGHIKSAASPSVDNTRTIPIAVYGIKNVG